MPPTLDQPPAVDEPSIIHDLPLTQPVLDDSNLKAMAAKFKQEWPGAPADGKVGSGTKKDAPADKAGVANSPPKDSPSPKPIEPGKDSAAVQGQPAVQPEGIEDVPEPAPNMPVTRDHFKRLAQSKEAFKKQAETLKAEREALAAKAAALEADLTKTKAALPPNLEEVQKALADAKRHAEENKALQEKLELVAFERSDKFTNWWKTETDERVRIAQGHVPPEKRQDVAKLLMEPPSTERDAKFDELKEGLPRTSQSRLDAALNELDGLRLKREDALKQGSERFKELQAHEQAEAQKQAQERAQKLIQATEEAIRRAKAGFTAFQPTGDTAKDAEIPQREAFVRALVAGKLDEETMLNIPGAAVEMLHLRDTVVPSLKAEIAKQAELIKQLQGSSPRAGEGKSSGGKAPDSKDAESGTSFAARVSSLMRG